MRISLALAAALIATTPAVAALAPGAKAPLFTVEGASAGRPIKIDLKTELKKGPVVLYFFPAAFTPGCNAEAHAFAEALEDFRKAGATVIGMTGGNIDQLSRFSSEMCAGKFAVAASSAAVTASYDVALKGGPGGYTNRTSYVIDRDGRVAYVYSDMNAADHVRNTLDAVRRLKRPAR